MLNILSNAVKYTEKGHVSLHISGETKDDQVFLTIQVSDTGRGIKPEDMERLFQDFVQFDQAKNKGIEGTGLGLAIAKSIVEAMGGEIRVQSEYEKGSVFTIALPQRVVAQGRLAEVNDPQAHRVIVYESNDIYNRSLTDTLDNLGIQNLAVADKFAFLQALPDGEYTHAFVALPLYEDVKDACGPINIALVTSFGEKIENTDMRHLIMPAFSIQVANVLNGEPDIVTELQAVVYFTVPTAHILVVDDISTNLNVAKGLLAPYQCQLTLCKSGHEALAAIENDTFDLIFMDHMMPLMDGIETTAHIRKNKAYANTPIVALTANAVSGTREMFLRNRFNDFLSKPIDTVKLNAIMEKWLPKAKQIKQTSEMMHTMPDPQQQQTAISIKGIDTKQGIAMGGGSLDNYLQTLRIFVRDGNEKIDEINDCLATGNFHLYTTYLHALKSAAANIGAFELSELAKALEAAGKHEDALFIKQNNPTFAAELAQLIQRINQVTAGLQQDIPTDVVALESELLRLSNAIDHFDLHAMKISTHALQAYATLPDVEDILQNTLLGDYDQAEDKIKALLVSLSKAR
jgi:CheY-like chemotaxis protein/anti-sigma regulatory factor (Ser/Thr protein kinase)